MIYLFLVLVFSGFFWNYFFFLDIVSHFHLQFFFIACLLVFWYFFKALWVELFFAVILWIFLFTRIIGSDFSGVYSRSIVNSPDLFYMNTEFQNTNIDTVSEYIKVTQPKQIALLELSEELFEKIKKEQKFSYSYYYPNDAFSFGFFTNEKVLDQKTYFNEGYPIGYFKTATKSFFIIHSLPPMSDTWYKAQKILFSDIATNIKDESNFIVVGDFNSAPYSRVFQSYFSQYLYKSLYSLGKYTVLNINMDQVISNKEYTVYPRKVESHEHIPLLIKF